MSNQPMNKGENRSLLTINVMVIMNSADAERNFSLAAVSPSGKWVWLGHCDNNNKFISQENGIVYIDTRKIHSSENVIQLIVYNHEGGKGIGTARNMEVNISGEPITLDAAELRNSCVLVGEIYRKENYWKLRCKKEVVADGIGEYLKRALITRTFDIVRAAQEQSFDTVYANSFEAEWTGTGLLISKKHLITNAHVVDNANRIKVSSFLGQDFARVLLKDRKNDLAILEVAKEIQGYDIYFQPDKVKLGEDIVALGYPLQHILGEAPQLTKGSISSLLGTENDASVLQVTCPVQPGSSGSPVFDANGHLVGMITSTLKDAQNVNFAVRASLIVALMEAIGIPFKKAEQQDKLDHVSNNVIQGLSTSVFRIGCAR